MKQLLWLLLLATTIGCASTRPPSVWFSWQARNALADMCETTTCTEGHNEVGQCLRGVATASHVFVTEVLSPTYQRSATRTSVLFLCSGLEGIVGHAHFHPWANAGECQRSSQDAIRHALFTYELDVVVCPEDGLRWYLRDGRAGDA